MAARGQPGNPSLRCPIEMGGRGFQRTGDMPQRVEAEQMFIGFKIADRLSGNLGLAFVVFGAVGELILGQTEL
jgi:hypothetical protein